MGRLFNFLFDHADWIAPYVIVAVFLFGLAARGCM